MLTIQNIKPWPIRLIVLGIIGIPAFTGWPIDETVNSGIAQIVAEIIGDNYIPFIKILAWLSYAVFIWLFIWLLGGSQMLLDFLLAASVLAITIALTKATLGKLPILSGGKDWETINLDSVLLLIKILTMIPYALLFVRSFSAASLLVSMSKKATKKNKKADHLAVFLRSFQYSIERFVVLLNVWKEENPNMLIPRARGDLHAPIWKKSLWFDWFGRSLWAWCVACLVNTLKAVPVFVDEAKRAHLSSRSFHESSQNNAR